MSDDPHHDDHRSALVAVFVGALAMLGTAGGLYFAGKLVMLVLRG